MSVHTQGSGFFMCVASLRSSSLSSYLDSGDHVSPSSSLQFEMLTSAAAVKTELSRRRSFLFLFLPFGFHSRGSAKCFRSVVIEELPVFLVFSEPADVTAFSATALIISKSLQLFI